MENVSLIELSLEEFRTNVTGAELIYFSGFLTRRYLENWALHGFIEPVGYNDNMRVNYTSYDYEKLEYCFGEAINYLVSQDIHYDILNKMIKKFRIEKGFSVSITKEELETQIVEAQRRINELEQINAELKSQIEEQRQSESLSTRRKNSYLKIIATLCNRNGKIDPAGRDSTGILKTELDNFGFVLSNDTIKNILKETQSFIEQESRIRI